MDHGPSPIASLRDAFCPEITQMDDFMATQHSTAVDTIYNTTRNCSEMKKTPLTNRRRIYYNHKTVCFHRNIEGDFCAFRNPGGPENRAILRREMFAEG